MALSLRDKLKSVSAQKKAPVRPPSDGCLVRRWHQEKTEGGLRKTLPGDVMSVMLGVPAEDIDRRSLLFLDTETTGLSGGAGSAEKRAALQKKLHLPANLGANAFLDALNLLMTREDFLIRYGETP